MHAAPMDWPLIQTGKPAAPDKRTTMSTGNGLMHPLAAAAKKAGVEILLSHRMTAIHREAPHAGPVLGITADNDGTLVNIRARKAVIIGTGGSTTNVNFRRMFDPRLTEEYCGVAGQPWSDQDASGELAGMAIGASLWGLFNNTGEFGSGITKPGTIGGQYGYVNLRWFPGQRSVRQGPRHRPAGQGLAGRRARQHDRQALLRRNRPAVQLGQLRLDRPLCRRTAIATARI